jgi:LL-diaminopimelate aminotransferase
MSVSQPTAKSKFTASERLLGLRPYALAKVFQARDEQIRRGADVIDLGVGNPDIRPPDHAVAALKTALDDPAIQNHRYPSFNGLPEFRRGIAAWYERRFGVTVDPEREVQPLIGSKEGIVKFMLAHLNPGDTVLQCTPCYPAYLGAEQIAQARIVEVPLLAKNAFLPDLGAIPVEEARRARVICVNYPGNPTGAVETEAFYHDLLRFAREYDLFVLSDIAYCDLSLDPSYRSRSFLEFDRDRERTLEFHSFSKSYSMQGWRIGFCAGHAPAIANLLKIKSNMDFGIFMAIQRAALAVLEGPQDYCVRAAALYRARRDTFLEAIAPLGVRVDPPRASLYVWLPVPPAFGSSIDFAADLLEKTAVVVSPGSGFGDAGEGYVRVALCVEEERLREAGRRMAGAGYRYQG